MNDASDKIVFKYKDKVRQNVPFGTGQIQVTWSSDTVFTVSQSTIPQWDYAQVGDEVTIASGNGAGSTAHIVTNELSGGTYTVTLDEAITGVAASDKAIVLVDNWIKIDVEITNSDTMGYKDIPIPQSSPTTWIKVKAEIRGEGVVIEELQFSASTQQVASS